MKKKKIIREEKRMRRRGKTKDEIWTKKVTKTMIKWMNDKKIK